MVHLNLHHKPRLQLSTVLTQEWTLRLHSLQLLQPRHQYLQLRLISPQGRQHQYEPMHKDKTTKINQVPVMTDPEHLSKDWDTQSINAFPGTQDIKDHSQTIPHPNQSFVKEHEYDTGTKIKHRLRTLSPNCSSHKMYFHLGKMELANAQPEIS